MLPNPNRWFKNVAVSGFTHFILHQPLLGSLQTRFDSPWGVSWPFLTLQGWIHANFRLVWGDFRPNGTREGWILSNFHLLGNPNRLPGVIFYQKSFPWVYCYCWVYSGRVVFQENSPQYRMLWKNIAKTCNGLIGIIIISFSFFCIKQRSRFAVNNNFILLLLRNHHSMHFTASECKQIVVVVFFSCRTRMETGFLAQHSVHTWKVYSTTSLGSWSQWIPFDLLLSPGHMAKRKILFSSLPFCYSC